MSLTTDPVGGATPDEIRNQVERMAISDTFRRSPQLGAFLRFVVEAVLHGKSDRIKAYTIGVEVLRRNTNFDPQIDPIVRVEATRLRRAIERYYAGPGADDRILIDLPRGSYVPTFRVGAPEVPDAAVALAPGGNAARVRVIAATLGLLVLVGIGLVFHEQARHWFPVDASRTTRPDAAAKYPGSGMPRLAIERFEATGTRGASAISHVALYEKMRDAFARFDTIDLVAASAQPVPGPTGTAADFSLRGFVNYLPDGTATVRFRLIDEGDRAVAWSTTTERIAATPDHDAIEDKVVLATAGTLLQPFGVIHSRARVKHLATPAGDLRYRCVIEASESLRSFDPVGHRNARLCLERLTVDAPSFFVGLRYLAAIYLREFLFGSGSRPAGVVMLNHALRTARRAVELHPEGARPYNTLASVYLARADAGRSLAASERAVALNKYDMAVLGDFGGRLIATGKIDQGMDLLQRAASSSTVRPAPHHFYLFLALYLKGDMPAATGQALQLTSDTYQLGLMARALVAQASGDRDAARTLIESLVALQPAWREDPHGQLAKFFPAAAIVDRLARDLATAGLAKRS